MKIFKTRIEDTRYFPVTPENFEEKTGKQHPWYQVNTIGEENYFAVCPACDNPTQIIGLYKLPAPYARHGNKTIEKLASFDKEALENCPLYLPRANPQKEDRKSSIDGVPLKILSTVINEFDRIVYILKKVTGINFSENLLRKMLATYKAAEGYLYIGASQLNTPWIFAYMSHAQPLYMQYIKNSALLEAIDQALSNAVITGDGQITAKEENGKRAFLDLNVAFIQHKSCFSNNTLSEKMTMIITTTEGKSIVPKTIYKEDIIFDHDFYQKILHKKDFVKNERLNALARDILGSVH